jgi:uncharacterized protein (DUF1800 family)
MDNLKQIKHLYARAGFGLCFADKKSARHTSVKKEVKELFRSSERNDPLSAVTGNTDYAMLLSSDELTKKQFMQQQRQQEKDLNLAWIARMSTSDAQLREKMTLFWHNHFACRSNHAAYAQQLNNIHRSYALGNFRDMLMAVSKAPAMLQFLNNQQNRKGHPNENFARELMELFTIGRGNYSEQDIRESARAFTGWGFDKDGQFRLRPFQHDDGQKTFMGKSGNLSGEDIISRLLEQKQTAYFISNKLYKYLVNEVPDPAHVSAMADVFYQSDYQIGPLLEHIFTADWFYQEKNMGNMIKSPVSFLVGLNRQFYIGYQRPEVMLEFQRALGQVLFYPPNVAGWPGGRNWIDSSSLMYRLKIPSLLLSGGLIDFSGKADPEDEAYLAQTRARQTVVSSKVEAQADWDKFLQGIPENLSKTEIAEFLLEPKLSPALLDAAGRSPDVKTMAIELASTPEYQLC